MSLARLENIPSMDTDSIESIVKQRWKSDSPTLKLDRVMWTTYTYGLCSNQKVVIHISEHHYPAPNAFYRFIV